MYDLPFNFSHISPLVGVYNVEDSLFIGHSNSKQLSNKYVYCQ